MRIADFLKSENIFEFAKVDFSRLRVTDERRLERMGFEPSCAVVFLMPYYVKGEKTNISEYAKSRDYHEFIKQLRLRAEKSLAVKLACFADTSPIDEVGAALLAGLGVIGKNGLIINKRYGSYVFIGEIFFEKGIDEDFFVGTEPKDAPRKCLECNACIKACPTGGINDRSICVSCINQKKRIDPAEEDIIRKTRSAWGCDVCQEVCPMNRLEETPIEFFREGRVERLDTETLDSLISSGEFKSRAFAWRGEAVLRRNLELTKE